MEFIHTEVAGASLVEPTPHLRAHFLDEIVVSSRTVVIGGNTVERGPGFA